MKQIEITVSGDGEVRLITRGFTGKSCIQETEFLKCLLGKETARSLTPAYYQEDKQQVKHYLPLCG